MKYIKTTWDDRKAAEKREHKSTCRNSKQAGKSSYWITCPFCDKEVIAYVWSIAGGGKRCPNCGAMHSYYGTSHRKKNPRKEGQ